MSHRFDTIETEFGDVMLHLVGCDYCGKEVLDSVPGGVYIEVLGFTTERLYFCSFEHAGLSLLAREQKPSIETLALTAAADAAFHSIDKEITGLGKHE